MFSLHRGRVFIGSCVDGRVNCFLRPVYLGLILFRDLDECWRAMSMMFWDQKAVDSLAFYSEKHI